MPSNNLDLALTYIRRMTDKTGMLEHAKFNEPLKSEGYTTDDNARAYEVMLKLGQPRQIYLDFLKRAVDAGGFHNDMNENGEWLDKPGLGEWFGRAMVATDLGIKTGDQNEKNDCRIIWDTAKPAFVHVTSLRTMAQLAIARVPYMAEKLVSAWQKNRFNFVGQKGWWKKGESKAEFDQQPVEAGSMVEACVSAYSATQDKKYLDWAGKAFAWYS